MRILVLPGCFYSDLNLNWYQSVEALSLYRLTLVLSRGVTGGGERNGGFIPVEVPGVRFRK